MAAPISKMNKVDKFKDICDSLTELYIEKNTDYGSSFSDTFNKLGLISAVTRISDKCNRLCSLATKSEKERLVKAERIEDTLMDLANYSILTLIELSEINDSAKDDNV